MRKQKIVLAVLIYRIILLSVLFNYAVSCSVYITLTMYGALMDCNWQAKTEAFQFHFAHHKCHLDWCGTEHILLW